MSVDRDELLKEIERCEYEKPRLVVWTQMDEFRLQVMKDLAAANARIEALEEFIESYTGQTMEEIGEDMCDALEAATEEVKNDAARKAAQ
jgi:GTPase involved in cell partitioning and DNA repair